MDLFQKCFDFTRADDVKKAGLYPYFRPVEENEGPVVRLEGRDVIMAGSNNYLGLTADPRVKKAAKDAIDRYGTGCSGSRYLTGTINLHVELEKRLAAYLGYEDVLLFSTGYQTALGTVSALVQKGDYVVSDKENHACIISAALLAKGGFAQFARYQHNDMADLDRVLAKIPSDAGILIVTDGVFSVSGELVNLPEMVDVAEKYGARILVDDAHATGVVGVGGRGTASHYGLTSRTHMTMGTFSKTFASLGGFVAGPERVTNYLKHHSPALIFSASPTPASVASTLAALEILEAEPWRIEKLLSNADKMRDGFKAMGYTVIDSRTGIVPVVLGDVEKTLFFWRQLYDRGVFVNAFIPPGVPPNLSMLRTSYMATHEDHHLDKILEVFGEVGRNLGMIP
ncbi:MAG: pyridoxal phosphate-dependent aminotransferase family protein [Chlorobi bacterium]|nr:MAG: pyridoxal phosphate-dependent aminotransferase family protein [Bacteroidota bacterium]KXK34527.1 MAG: 8-amino-7-oxononanoate synthase [Chlorobi bacterium OLB6]MBE2264822.1 pyridoxal phosphate-dependent aminotransferase family protein [Flavobacteriales bacterium]MBL1160824.1 pyridoxal phosphate-dependent aminotransferase family protein [Chlorobiota bacterium]MBW7852787.1 pyridoxal phosphate-dependent aminotransferase family protein [Candidatus Kapabacteria bacterium]MCC6330974.1 pyridox